MISPDIFAESFLNIFRCAYRPDERRKLLRLIEQLFSNLIYVTKVHMLSTRRSNQILGRDRDIGAIFECLLRCTSDFDSIVIT